MIYAIAGPGWPGQAMAPAEMTARIPPGLLGQPGGPRPEPPGWGYYFLAGLALLLATYLFLSLLLTWLSPLNPE